MELPTVQSNEHASTNPPASNSVFSNLQGGRLDRLAGWLGRELHRLFRERIYTAAGFGSRLVHDRHLDEAGNDELAGFIQLLIAHSRHLLDDGLYVSLGNLRSLCNCINQLIFRHLGHAGFLCGGSERFEAHELRGGASLCFKRGKATQLASRSCLWSMKTPGLKPIEAQNARRSSVCVPCLAGFHPPMCSLIEPSPNSRFGPNGPQA